MTEKKLTELPERTQIAAMQKFICNAVESRIAIEGPHTLRAKTIKLMSAYALLTLAKKGNDE